MEKNSNIYYCFEYSAKIAGLVWEVRSYRTLAVQVGGDWLFEISSVNICWILTCLSLAQWFCGVPRKNLRPNEKKKKQKR